MAKTGGESGKGNPGNFANDREKAKEAGHIGGQHQGKDTNPGNFANDRGKASEAGRKGGQQSNGGRTTPK
jgi:general stress protein YciG